MTCRTSALFLPILIGAALAIEAIGGLMGRFAEGHNQLAALLVCGATMALLATRALPEYLSAFIFFVVCVVGALAPPAVVLSGFAGSAVWLVISGAVIGAALRHTGLAQRSARLLAGRQGVSFPLFLGRVALFGTGLLFLMPSAMGRVLLLIPMLEAVITQAGLEPTDRRATGIMLAGLFGTFFPAMAVLPANVPNNVLIGLLETTGIGAPSFTSYLLLHFPVLGLVKLMLIVGLLGFAFRREPALPGRRDRLAAVELSRAERRLLGLLGLTILLWLSDGWHGVSAAWVGMGAAIICLWPGSGLMPESALRSVGMEPVFYVAGVVGIGAVLGQSGAGAVLGELIGALVDQAGAGPGASVVMLVAIAALLGLFVTIVAVPAILTPIAQSLAAATGLPVDVVVMSQVVGFSTVFFPYQAPPLAVAMQTNGHMGAAMVRFCLRLAVLTVLVIWPLDLLWWRLLGWLPG